MAAPSLPVPADFVFRPLSPLEQKLWDLATAPDDGGGWHVRMLREDVAAGQSSPAAGHVRAWLLAAVCCHGAAPARLRPAGLTLRGAWVEGELRLAFGEFPFPLSFVECTFEEPVNFNHATIAHLRFQGGSLPGFRGNGLRVRGDLALEDGVCVTGPMELRNARVEGDLRLGGASLHCSHHPGDEDVDAYALSAAGIRVRGNLIFERRGAGRAGTPETFRSVGCVSLVGASVGGNVHCTGARMERIPRLPEGWAEPLSCAFWADLAEVKGSVMMKTGFEATGEVRMLGIRVHGTLACGGARLDPGEADALSLDGAHLGSLNLNDGFHTLGKVRLIGAQICDDLDCSEGVFTHAAAAGSTAGGGTPARRIALSARHVRIGNNVYLNGAQFLGEVRLLSAEVGGDCVGDGVTLRPSGGSPDGDDGAVVLNLANARLQGSCRMKGFHAYGSMSFQRAELTDLVLESGTLGADGATGIMAQSARIRGTLTLRDTPDGGHTAIRLDHARAGRIVHGFESWPASGKLSLRGSRYLSVDLPQEGTQPLANGYFIEPTRPAERYARWIGLAAGDGYDPQPYEQLERSLLRSGDEEAAKVVGVRKKDARSREMGFGDWVIARLFGMAVSHGYESKRLFAAALVFIVFGSLVFELGDRGRLLTPVADTIGNVAASGVRASSPRGDAPALNTLVYSVDTFLPPVIDFYQEKYWVPRAGPGWAPGLLRAYHWLHIFFGWIISTLLLVSLTAVMRGSR
jgi:hypothetical protein